MRGVLCVVRENGLTNTVKKNTMVSIDTIIIRVGR